MSRPTRACGLKQARVIAEFSGFQSRPTRACGLKRHLGRPGKGLLPVTPHTGVWIETFSDGWKRQMQKRHAPHGRVD